MGSLSPAGQAMGESSSPAAPHAKTSRRPRPRHARNDLQTPPSQTTATSSSFVRFLIVVLTLCALLVVVRVHQFRTLLEFGRVAFLQSGIGAVGIQIKDLRSVEAPLRKEDPLAIEMLKEAGVSTPAVPKEGGGAAPNEEAAAPTDVPPVAPTTTQPDRAVVANVDIAKPKSVLDDVVDMANNEKNAPKDVSDPTKTGVLVTNGKDPAGDNIAGTTPSAKDSAKEEATAPPSKAASSSAEERSSEDDDGFRSVLDTAFKGGPYDLTGGADWNSAVQKLVPLPTRRKATRRRAEAETAALPPQDPSYLSRFNQQQIKSKRIWAQQSFADVQKRRVCGVDNEPCVAHCVAGHADDFIAAHSVPIRHRGIERTAIPQHRVVFAVIVSSGLGGIATGKPNPSDAKDGDVGFVRVQRYPIKDDARLVDNFGILGADRAVVVEEDCASQECNASLHVVCRSKEWGREGGLSGGFPPSTPLQAQTNLVSFSAARAQHGRFATCMQMVERWESDFGITFDWVVKHRPDDYYTAVWPRFKDVALPAEFRAAAEGAFSYAVRFSDGSKGTARARGTKPKGRARSRRGSSSEWSEWTGKKNLRANENHVEAGSTTRNLVDHTTDAPRRLLLEPTSSSSSNLSEKPPRLPLLTHHWAHAFGGIDWYFAAPRKFVAPLVARLSAEFHCSHFQDQTVLAPAPVGCKGTAGSECVLAAWTSYHGVSLLKFPWVLGSPGRFCGGRCPGTWDYRRHDQLLCVEKGVEVEREIQKKLASDQGRPAPVFDLSIRPDVCTASCVEVGGDAAGNVLVKSLGDSRAFVVPLPPVVDSAPSVMHSVSPGEKVLADWLSRSGKEPAVRDGSDAVVGNVPTAPALSKGGALGSAEWRSMTRIPTKVVCGSSRFPASGKAEEMLKLFVAGTAGGHRASGAKVVVGATGATIVPRLRRRSLEGGDGNSTSSDEEDHEDVGDLNASMLAGNDQMEQEVFG